MAKTGSPDVATPRATAAELKKELRRLVKAIVDDEDDDDRRMESYEEASRALSALKDLSIDSNRSGRKKNSEVPEHFLCPISSEIMKDPVVLSSGQTYDRPYIEQWLNSGNRTCPKTQQVLTSPTTLTPNHLVRSMISQWCSEHGTVLPPPSSNTNIDGSLVTADERTELDSLLKKLSSSSVLDRKQATKELRLRTRRKSSFRSLVGQNPEAIPKLLSILSSSAIDGDLQEDAVTAILNLSIEDCNKKCVGDNKEAILLLIDALTTGINMQTRGNAAAALFTLSALDSNKIKIVQLGAMRPLVNLLEHGNLPAKKDAGSAIFNLCTVRENRAVAAGEGVAIVSLRMIKQGLLVAESLALLALLSPYEEVVDELAEDGGVACLLRIVRESSCARNKENATVVLYSICVDHRRKLKEVKEEENLYGTLSDLEQGGTPRAQRKAAGLLDRLRKAGHNTHYSC
ncbi:U-box domain-containing protein 9-like [Iris pallida]|uniref:RING-type E3 ubiquitin transferase n=1 Tax=Iris pallida TaxID=29817 RepID=A0AAX6HXZ8_IRIPA|nr:U-box domain-containing protein 9-like [Iris pallida]